MPGDKARRRQAREDRRTYHHIEDDQHAAACERQIQALGHRAAGSLDTLARLKRHYDDGLSVLALAVAGLRAQDYSDAEIGRALGCTRQAVGERFGRKGSLDTGPVESGVAG